MYITKMLDSRHPHVIAHVTPLSPLVPAFHTLELVGDVVVELQATRLAMALWCSVATGSRAECWAAHAREAPSPTER